MLKAYFMKPSRIRKIMLGPLGKQMDEFAERLKADGYSRLTAQQILTTAGAFNNYLHARELLSHDITPELIASFTTERQNLIKVNGIQNQVSHFIRFLRNKNLLTNVLCQTSPPKRKNQIELFLDKYASFLRNVRGCSESYIGNTQRGLCEFLSWAFPEFSESKLHEIDGKMIMTYFSEHPQISMHKVGFVRVFCRYLYGTDRCSLIPHVIFPSAQKYKMQSPPKSIPQDEVYRILDSCDRNYPDGMRDYAAILALASLGLRCQEVAKLNITDIDWRSAKIKIKQTKVGRERILPLSQQLGKAFEEYLLYGRPNSEAPQLFLRHRAPSGAFTSKALYCVISRAAKRASVKLPHASSNIFRHSLATNMVNQGVSIKIISDLLDHRSIDTTAIYTMVDFSTMKNIILPLPGGVL